MMTFFEVLGQIALWIIVTFAILAAVVIAVFNTVADGWKAMGLIIVAAIVIFGGSGLFGMFALGMRFHAGG